MPGIPLYLQFKRADCLTTRRADEIRKYGLRISLPFYRFKITEAKKSDQHELLLALDDGSCVVAYAAPRFHELDEINDAWANNNVASESIFVLPSMIGALDDDSHFVSYDARRTWLRSGEPQEIQFLNSAGLLAALQAKIQADHRPMRKKLPELSERLISAEHRARARLVEKGEAVFYGEATERIQRDAPVIRTRAGRPLSNEENQLREIADRAAKVFHTQLIIVQDDA
jgi:hypothetical protein